MNNWNTVKRFLIIFLPLMILVGSITMFVYYKDVKTKRLILEAREVEVLNHQKDIIVGSIMSIMSDLMFLSDHIKLKEMLEGGNVGDKEDLSKDFLSFSIKKELYDQIRFLDEKGREVIRVNFNAGKPYIVPEENLQSKAGRSYFIETLLLKRGEVFASPFDLNLEKGKIEQPIKPMIRFGTPVFDNHGQKRGVLILNYLGRKLIDNLRNAYIGSPGNIMLLNSDGFWLHGPTQQDEWGFMYEEREDRTFKNDFSEFWRKISEVESGQFFNSEGVFTFVTLFPILEALRLGIGSSQNVHFTDDQSTYKAYYWKLLSHVPSDVMNSVSKKIFSRLILIYTSLTILLALGSLYLARLSESRRMASESLVKSEAELRKHRDKLEEMVNDRTVDLKKANEQLQREIIDRENSEKQLWQKSKELEDLTEELRGLATQLSKKEEISRKKFARILHEQLGQNLAAIRIKCYDLSEETISDKEEIRESFQNLILLINDTIQSTRELTSDLYPTIIDDLGFISAVNWYGDLVLKPSKLKVFLDIDDFVEGLPLESKLSLFRIVQECFQNVVKHSKASKVELVLRRVDRSMELFIKDNGVGFSFKKNKKKIDKGIGLMLINERALSLGGNLKVKSDSKRGTEFIVEIPLEGQGAVANLS